MLTAIGGNLEEMAFSLGSSRWRAFRTVTLKLTVPGLANAFLLLFAASLADFATPLSLAGNDLPVLANRGLSANHRHVAVLKGEDTLSPTLAGACAGACSCTAAVGSWRGAPAMSRWVAKALRVAAAAVVLRRGCARRW